MTTAFNLQIDPVNPGMQFHRIHRFEDNHVRSMDPFSHDAVKVFHEMDISK